MGQARILVVVDSEANRQPFRARFSRGWTVDFEYPQRFDASTVSTTGIEAAIIEADALGSALNPSLSVLRARMPDTLLVVVAEEFNIDLVNLINLLRAELMGKRDNASNLDALANRLLSKRETLCAPLNGLARQHGLTNRETEMLEQAMIDPRRRSIAARLRVSEETVKHHVRSLLRKMNHESLRELVYELRRTKLPPV